MNTTAATLCNRSFCSIKLEHFGSAIEDANKALEIDPNFVKAHYRIGAAYIGLGKYKDARAAFKKVLLKLPNDPDAKNRVKLCSKEIKAEQFREAIACEETKSIFEQFNLDDYVIDDTYDGVKYTKPITKEFIDDMVDRFKKQKLIPKKYVIMMLLDIAEEFKKEPNIVNVTLSSKHEQTITVCGDTHGQFYDTLHIFEENGNPSENNLYLFNGDIVDRGSFSVENVLTLFSYYLLKPKCLYINRGNHEGTNMNSLYGFAGEVNHKYDNKVMQLFSGVFNYLPLGTLIENSVFVCHGGLFSKDNVTLKDINDVNRFREIPDSGLMCEILWSDPQPQGGRGMSKRGIGIQFGPDVTKNFCDTNNLKMIIRSHEVKDGGYEIAHDISFFSNIMLY